MEYHANLDRAKPLAKPSRVAPGTSLTGTLERFQALKPLTSILV